MPHPNLPQPVPPSPFRSALPFARAMPTQPPFRLRSTALRPPASSAPRLPLQGLTVLVVEDSRYASDALRLMCQRSGARLRRAEDLTSAAAHLRCYRPDVVIIDIGLPDGDGAGLIAQLSGHGIAQAGSAQAGSAPLVLGTSGDPGQRAAALAAGAKGFMEKPVAGLLAFQAAILAHITPGAGVVIAAPSPDQTDTGAPAGDPLALADDLRQAARALSADPPPPERAWLADFLDGLAGQAHDPALAGAAAELRDPAISSRAVADFLRDRLRRISESGLATQPP